MAPRGNSGQVPPQGAVIDPGRGRHLQTHMVASGRFKISAYEDVLPDGAGVLRALSDGAIVARRRADGSWSRPVKEARERKGPAVAAARGPAVVVTLDKGRYY